MFGFCTDQRAALDGCNHATGSRDVEALADAVAAAGPAGVDQVDLGFEAADTLDQQFCVFIKLLGTGGVKVPKWNRTANSEGGAVCTATSRATNLSTYAWAAEFTMK